MCTILCMYEGEAETTGKTERQRRTYRGLMWCHIVDNHLYARVFEHEKKNDETVIEVILYPVKAEALRHN